MSKEEVNDKQCAIEEGQKAERTICDYVDSLISTDNPCNPDELNWMKPKTHPCKRRFHDIKENEWDKDYENLINSVERHTHCSTAYCLCKKDDDNLSCRFNYPKDCCEKTYLQYEEIRSKDGILNYKVKVVTKHNDTRLNNHQPLQLQGWRANCDIQVIIDYHSCLEYIAKYASTGEKLSSVAKDVFTSVICDSTNDSDSKSVIKKLMMRAIGERDMGIQEVMQQILSIQLLSSSFQVVTASLNGSRNITIESDKLKTEPSILDLYAKRTLYESDFPGISKNNFIEFASNFSKAKLGLKRRGTPVVVKSYPNYSSNPKGPNYGSFCKYQLLKFKPWVNCLNNAWNNQEGCDSIYIETWHSFLNTAKAKKFVPDWSHQLYCKSQYVHEISDENDTNEYETGEREEWMYLADLKFQNDSNADPTITCHQSEEYWSLHRTLYTLQEIGDMPLWINEQKKNYSSQITTETKPVDINSLNHAQHTTYDIVSNHLSVENYQQLLMIITGLAGSGKSYLIDTVKSLLNERCKVCAYFGIAAFNINGSTLHSLLQLPIRGKRNGPLTSSALSKLQDDLTGVTCLIIDEFSVIGQKMFGWINRRLKQATGFTTSPFGGISIILVGDIAQLPPVSDSSSYGGVLHVPKISNSCSIGGQ